MTIRIATCGKCHALLAEPPELPVEERLPSPCCRSLGRQMNLETGDVLQVGLREKMRLRSKRPGRAGWLAELITGDDFWRDEARWVKLLRQIDWENDYYYKRIVDPQTGAVIHERPPGRLSDHQGYGRAKNRN
jgi:hypothetical protein